MTAIAPPPGPKATRVVRRGDLIRVLEADRSLADGLDTRLAERLRLHLVAEVVSVSQGHGLGVEPAGGHFLVVDGLIARRVSTWGRHSIELFGGGDVIASGAGQEPFATHPTSATWRVLSPSRFAVLDTDFYASAVRAPAIGAALMRRLAHQSHALGARLAIAQMPNLEARLLALFWQLADRWGRVDGAHVVIPLRLSHEILAELVGAQRPSVSLALRHLLAAGKIARLDTGWRIVRE